MKRDILRNYVLVILLIIILSLALFVSNIFSRKLLALILAIYTIIVRALVKKRSIKPTYEKQVILMMSIFAIMYLLVYYLMGLYFGYYEASATFSFKTILNFILPITIIIISSEFIRNIFIKQNGKLITTLLFLTMVLIDLIVYSGIYDLSNLDDFLAVIGFILFASVACNLLYNYVAKRFGIKGIIIYRLITILYVYIIPIIPNIYIFFQSFLRMLCPYIIYLVLEYTYSKANYAIEYKDKKKNIISISALLITMTILIALISCNFRYGLLVVGSGSMTGSIDKGDIVFFEKYDEQELEEGMIIIFNHNDVKTVHRIMKMEHINGEVRYYTKGDANSSADAGYSLDDDIVGVVYFRIRYLGYPTIWVRDIFSKK